MRSSMIPTTTVRSTATNSCVGGHCPATPTDGDWGWGVLQQRGVAAWLRVRDATAPARSAPTRAMPPVARSATAELVELLASMALGVAARG
jgi:hypothetical protein